MVSYSIISLPLKNKEWNEFSFCFYDSKNDAERTEKNEKRKQKIVKKLFKQKRRDFTNDGNNYKKVANFGKNARLSPANWRKRLKNLFFYVYYSVLKIFFIVIPKW